MFSWHDTNFEGSLSDVYIEYNKFALLSGLINFINNLGDISETSDEYGIVEFKNLTVLATTTRYFYLYAICDNSAVKLWSSKISTIYEDLVG